MTSTTRVSNRSHPALLLFGLFFVVYLMSYSGNFLTTDERALYAAASSLALRGSPTANQLYWEETGVVLINSSGDRCANYEPAQVVLSAPLIWLARWLPRVGLVHAAFLFNALVTAATVAVLFLYVVDLGHKTSTGLITAGLFGLATIAWPYSKTFFREPLSGLAPLAGAWFLLRLGRSARPWDAGLAGFAFGLTVATKQANALALVALAPFGVSYLLQASRSTRKRLVLALLVILAALLVIVPGSLYQQACGRPQLDVARASIASPSPQNGSFWEALTGFLFSPGKSLFIYAPVLLAIVVGLPLGWRLHRRESLLSMLVFVVYLLGYSALRPAIWWGGLCWGPRYVVTVVPILCVSLAPVVAWALAHPRTVRSLLFVLLIVLSLGVQLVGISVPGLAYSAAIGRLRPDGMWTLALYNPVYSQPLYSLRLLEPGTLDFAWIHTVGDQVQVDWLFLAAAAGVLCLMAAALWRALRRPLARWAGVGLLVACMALASLLLVRRYEDPRFGGGSDYHALVQDLRRQASVDDVLVVANHFYTDFFLNYDKASPDWYAIVKAGENLEPSVEALFERLILRHDRIWWATDQTPALGLPHPDEDWLVARLYPLQETTYSPYCRLTLFSTKDLPDPAKPAVQTELTLGNDIRLVGYDLPNRTLRGGDALELSLLWEARQHPDQDLTVFVQLIGPDGRVVWQVDQYPVRGQRPTSSWQPGDQIRDQYGWLVPRDQPAGTYRLIAGLYQLDTMVRLPVTDAAGRDLGDFVDLGAIEIE